MLSSRSARLAACLLMSLLLGWVVRSYRKETTATHSAIAPAQLVPIEESSKNTFPDE